MEYKTKILIADESPAVRSNLREGLLRAGYLNVEEAANGEEAVLKISHLRPDVVLLDVWLSKLDGIGVLRTCRSMDWSDAHEPAYIVVSSVSNQNVFIQATEAGAELCLLKPVNVASLAEHIQSLAVFDLQNAQSGTCDQNTSHDTQLTDHLLREKAAGKIFCNQINTALPYKKYRSCKSHANSIGRSQYR